MVCRELQIKWTNCVEVSKEGPCIERAAVWEGVNQDGEKVRVYISRIEGIDAEKSNIEDVS